MATIKLEARVKAIEGKQPAPGACRCSWLAVATVAELEGLTVCPRCGLALTGRKKAYVGISPDAWDGAA